MRKRNDCGVLSGAVLFMLLAGHVRAVTRIWVGAGTDGLWTTSANWSGGFPAASDDVVFLSGQRGTVNNLVTSLHSVTFGAGSFSVVGNSIVLTNGINTTNASAANTFATPITLGSNQSITNLTAGTELVLVTVDLAGRALTFRGAGTNLIANAILDSTGGGSLTNAGTGVFFLSGTNSSFIGATTLTAGTNVINSFHSRSPITWTAGTLSGTGHLGQVTASGIVAKGLRPGYLGTGLLTTSNLVLNASVTNFMEINGTSPGLDYDQIVVSNANVTLGSSTLNLAFLSTLTPLYGDTITLINLVNPTNTVTGTFAGLPEGSTFTNNSFVYQLSYAGGDGNDVTLTVSGVLSTGNSRSWDGSGTNNNWQNATNWSLNVAPLQGDGLTFPAVAARPTNFNDFAAETTFDSLFFSGPAGTLFHYAFGGSSFRLNNGIRVGPPSPDILTANGNIIISNRIGLNFSQLFTNRVDAALRLPGGVDLAGNTLLVNTRPGGALIFFDGPISGDGQLVIAGDGIHLAASNAITGSILVTNGMPFIDHAQALGTTNSGPVQIGASGAIRLQNSNTIFTGSSILLTGRLELVVAPGSVLAAPIMIASSNAVISATNTIFGFTNFTVAGPVTNTMQVTNLGFGGPLRIGTNCVVQGGGVIQNLGVIDVDGIVHNVVNNGYIFGSLTGSGQIDTLRSTNGGSITPGSASDSTLAFNPLRVGTLLLSSASSATLRISLFPDRPGGGPTNTAIICTDAPDLGFTVLSVTAVTNLTPNQKFTIVRNDSAAPITNTFRNLPEGGVLPATNGNHALSISYAGGDGNDVVLTVLSNTPPTFAAAVTNLSVSEIGTLTYSNAVIDFERPPQTLTWTLLTPMPNLTLNPTTGVLVWSPDETQGPSTNALLVKVTDNGAPPMSSTGTVVVTILEVNQPPVPVAVTTNVIAGNSITVQLMANDPDIPPNPLVWVPVTLPAGASLTTNGVYTYNSTLFDAGPKTNTVKVYDLSTNAINQQSFTNSLTFIVNVMMRRIVTNMLDSGLGSLRQAISDVSTNPSGGIIEFNIPGTGVHKIAPLTQLPPLGATTFLDGYTQPGAHPNAGTNGMDANILIELSGENQAGGGDGLYAPINGITIRGLCINRFTTGAGINFSSCCGSACGANSGNAVQGCLIGTDTSGTLALPNARGVVFACTSSSQLGGSDPSQRNLISGNLFEAVQISGDHSTGNLTIQNNFIGTDRTGTNALPNSGCGILTPSGGVGQSGPTAFNCLIADNVIGTNHSIGVNFGGTSNIFIRNQIGVGADGFTRLGNGDVGLYLTGAGHRVGGTNQNDGNTIAYNAGAGIWVGGSDDQAESTNYTILGNSIFANGGLAIDLGHAGRNTNDLGDIDTGPNHLQNFPILISAVAGATGVTLTGTLNTRSNTVYRLEFFHSPDFTPSNQPQAKTFLLSTNVTTDAAGNVGFSLTSDSSFSSGLFTATATDPSGNTSEISDGLAMTHVDILLLGSQMRLRWTTNLAGFTLQSNTTVLQPNTWSNVPGTLGVTNGSFFRDFPLSDAPRFFRLRSP